MTEFFVDTALLRRVIRAIETAISDDVPRVRREVPLETENYIKFIRSDFINENIKKMVVNDNVELLCFTRYAWKGRMLVDKKNKITYSITTEQNLNAIPKKKDRSMPHFLQTMLGVENTGMQAQYVQQTLFPMEQFDMDTLQQDFDSIVNGFFDPKEGYTHYIICYTFEKDELLTADLKLLDRKFNTVQERSLNEYIKPDFAQLTNVEYMEEEVTEEKTGGAKRLVSLKAGLRPQLHEVEKKA